MNSLIDTYARIGLPHLEPVVNAESIERVRYTSEQLLHFWALHTEASAVCQALHVSMVRTNIDNSVRHSKVVKGSADCDANRIARGIRPHSALLLSKNDGIDSVEVVASLASSDDEPHNALSLRPTERGLELILQHDDWRQPVKDSPRSRIKLTRYYPEDKPEFVVVQAKLDQQGFKDMEYGQFFGVKGRRSGYLTLEGLDNRLLADIDTVVNTPEYEPGSPDVELARRSILEFLSNDTEHYQAVVDRVYATRGERPLH